MTDTERLQKAIDDLGLKKTFIADTLGISYQTYLNKESGKTEFLGSEIARMKKLLRFTNKQTIEIFLTLKVPNNLQGVER